MMLVAYIDKAWRHINNRGVGNYSSRCEAGVYRFEVDIPESAHAVKNTLFRDNENGVPDPYSSTIAEEDADD